MRIPLLIAPCALLLAGCLGDDTNPALPAVDASLSGPACASTVAAAQGDGGGACATCLESACFAQLSAVGAATAGDSACAEAQGALATCAGAACGPACGGSLGTTTLDSGAPLSAACQTYVSCCVAANSAALLDAGISLASIELSCDQNASVATDAECTTLTAEFLDAGVTCP